MSLVRFVAIVMCVGILAGSLPAPVAAVLSPFTDMGNSWFLYTEAVTTLQKRGVIDGYADGTYKPMATINRAEFLKIVFGAKQGPTPVHGSCFTDVAEDAWYAPFVCAALRRDVIRGYSDGSFHPGEPVNMAEAMKMVLLAYGEEVGTEKTGAKWYETYTGFLDRNGILPRSSYLPWQALTRERAADLLLRVLDFQEGKKDESRSRGCRDPGTVQTTVTVRGKEQSFLLTMPRSSSDESHPLVIAFHGRTNSNAQVRSYYGIDRSMPDAVIAYPEGWKSGSAYSWTNDQGKPDIALFDAIVEEIANHTCIDLDRIYTVGHSLGAWMANSVACARGGIVRASATVGGDSAYATCTGPSASLMIHHQRDNLASFASAEKARDRRLSANACGAPTKPVEPSVLQCREYTDCDDGSTLVWCPHELDNDDRGDFYPHQWPKGTGKIIAEFFGSL